MVKLILTEELMREMLKAREKREMDETKFDEIETVEGDGSEEE